MRVSILPEYQSSQNCLDVVYSTFEIDCNEQILFDFCYSLYWLSKLLCLKTDIISHIQIRKRFGSQGGIAAVQGQKYLTIMKRAKSKFNKDSK